jgi:hypothetical protein
MKYRKKEDEVIALTFDEFIRYGVNSGANIVNGMPWSFNINGYPVTHENDRCYLIPTTGGTLRFTPDYMLVTENNGVVQLITKDVFDFTYKKSTCKYLLHHPADEGYSDVKGYFYQCSECEENYIDIEDADEFTHCPFCGREIVSYESLQCIDCKHAEWDGDGWICGNEKGKFHYDDIEDTGFCGCQEYEYEEKHLEERKE